MQSRPCAPRAQPARTRPAIHRGAGDSQVLGCGLCVDECCRRSRRRRLYFEVRCSSKARLHHPPVLEKRARLERQTNSGDRTRGHDNPSKSSRAESQDGHPRLMGRHPTYRRPQRRAEGLPSDGDCRARRRLAQLGQPGGPDAGEREQAERHKSHPKEQLGPYWEATKPRQPTLDGRDA